jgi:hypothetical protein
VYGDAGFRAVCAMWFELVKEYSAGQFTKADDKLIALSSLAQRIQPKVGMEYLAGLWNRTFVIDLLWYVVRSAQPRPPGYRAPTWSWAPVDGQIEHEVYNDRRPFDADSEPMVRLVNVELVTHLLDVCKTGQIFGGSATITASLRKVDDFTFAMQGMASSHLSNSVSIYYQKQRVGGFRPDTVPFETKKLYFLMATVEPFRDQSPIEDAFMDFGLALTRKDGYYEWVGMSFLSEDGLENLPTGWLDGFEEQTVIIR